MKNFQGESQFNADIHSAFRPSACGPVTASVILKYLNHPLAQVPVNELYKLLGTTRIGLFTWRFVHRFRKLLGRGWEVRKCSLSEVLHELDNGRPAAAKFDKWFTRKWKGRYEFDYHWVPVIGYEKVANDIILAIHDNGSPSSSGNIRLVSYRDNCPVLTFVKIAPLST